MVAARLSENPDYEVVLIERGPHYSPGEWPVELTHSHRIIKESHDWEWWAKAGASPRLVHVPRGRVVGGSSVTNGAVALRGHPEHYDEWDQWVDGWGWESWLPWFRLLENDLDHGADDHHGDAGPIGVSRWPRDTWFELQERFAEAALGVGHSWVDDHNAPGAIGIGPIPLNMIDGVRQTPADHYLAPSLGRENLSLLAGLTVDRLEMSGEKVTAVHTVDEAGTTDRHDADVVIMALGSYATPGALLRSGIGPEDELSRHGIEQRINLPVGLGMQDHPKVSYRFDIGLPAPEWPNPWYQVLLTGEHEVAGERRVYQVMPYSGQSATGQTFTDLNVQVSDAVSRRGRVRLHSTNPLDQPSLQMGWLMDDGDRAAAVAAGEKLIQVSAEYPLAEILSPWHNISDADQVLRTVETFHHPVGSCRMGRADDPGAVADSTGRVLDTEGLWIMDASLMARVPSANTHLPVIAMAERLAAGFDPAS